MNIYRIYTTDCPTWFTEAENPLQALAKILTETLDDPTGSDHEELSQRRIFTFEVDLFAENTTIEAYELVHPGFHDQ